jgi:hypothetical protein
MPPLPFASPRPPHITTAQSSSGAKSASRMWAGPQRLSDPSPASCARVPVRTHAGSPRHARAAGAAATLRAGGLLHGRTFDADPAAPARGDRAGPPIEPLCMQLPRHGDSITTAIL